MKLSVAAGYFDRTICQDSYNPATTFKAQLDVFDDSKKDSLGSSRRILSAKPTVTIPPRSTIFFSGYHWLVSAPYTDEFLGSTIRNKYSIQRCDGSALIRTAAEVIGNTGGVTAYTGRTLIKTGKDTDSAYLTNRYDYFFATSEVVPEKSILVFEGSYFMVRSTSAMPTDFLKVTVDELKAPALDTITFNTRTYQPTTDSYVSSPTACKMLRVQWELAYAYTTEATEKYREGDLFGLVRMADIVTAKAGSTVTSSDGVWTVLTVTNEGSCWGLHLRRA